MKVAFVTGSPTKYAIAAQHMTPFGIEPEHIALDLTELQSPIVEDVAVYKAAQAFEILGSPCIVEDSAFGIDELGGYPGTNVKHLITAAGAKVIAHLADLTTTRACTCTAALVYVDVDGNRKTFVNSRPGKIARSPQGDSGRLALWTVYCPPGSDVPLAAMAPAAYRRWQDWWAANSLFAQCGQWLASQHEGGRLQHTIRTLSPGPKTAGHTSASPLKLSGVNLDDSQPAAHAFTGPREGDAFGQLLLRAHTTDGPVCEVMERDDGLISTGDARRYLSTLDGDAFALDRQMLALARGRVLDVGCGAGRHALHLQAAGLDVTGLELSPGAVQVARARGVHVIHGSIFDPPEVGRFDTIVLVGNNLSLLGSPQQAPQMLHVLSRLADPHAIIIAEGLDPYHAAEADHVAYHQRNRAAGRAGGQVRMRVRAGAVATGWMQLWQLSPAELQQVLHGSGWQIRQLRLRDSGPGYFAELTQAPQ